MESGIFDQVSMISLVSRSTVWVDYELTALGLELLEPVSALGQWAVTNHARVIEARRSYDDRAT